MAIRNGDRARFNRRRKKFAFNRERIRAFRAALEAAKETPAVKPEPPAEPKA